MATDTGDKNESQPSRKDLIDGVKKNKTIWVTGITPPFDTEFAQLKQLGNAGQYGVTYQCKKHKDGKLFAVKHVNKNRFYRIDAEHRHRFLSAMNDEISILKTLKHKYIINFEAVYEDKTTLFLVMEECRGGELFKRICERGKYTEKAAASVMKQLLSALRYMHEECSIVHCDLKPDNILFLTEADDSPVKIIDFGMSKVLPRLQYLNHLCGTPYYTAPEVIKHRKYNHACDMWSLGVILFVMVYGYPPFYVDPQKYGQNERKAIYEKICNGFQAQIKQTDVFGYGPWFPDHLPTSDGVKDLISKLLEKQVRKRYTAKEALTHPWITNLQDNSDENLQKHLFSRLLRFNNECQFKVVITKIFRMQFFKMRPEHFQQLEVLFQSADTDGDGILSFKEFKSAVVQIQELNIDPQHLQQIYQQLAGSSMSEAEQAAVQAKSEDEKQVDGDDQPQQQAALGIRFSDLLNALVYDYLIACDERLYDAFRKLDDDNDGKITTQQLRNILQDIDPLGEWEKAIKIIEEQSLSDQNGVIDYEEFLLNLHPNFEETPDWMPDLFKQMSTVTFYEQSDFDKIGSPKTKSPKESGSGSKKKSSKSKSSKTLKK